MFKWLQAAFFAFALVACGSSSESNTASSSEDDDGASTTTTSGTGGSTGSSDVTTSATTTGAGGTAMCHPDGWCETTPNCECQNTYAMTDEFCSIGLELGHDICPEGASTCGMGRNECGNNLPLGQAYEAPNCTDFVNGDIWHDATGTVDEDLRSEIDINRQTVIVLGEILTPNALYFTNFTISGNKLYWNVKNRGTTEFGIGEFSAKDGSDNPCGKITIRLYDPGADDSAPSSTYELFWFMH